jgi:hypothetical protein
MPDPTPAKPTSAVSMCIAFRKDETHASRRKHNETDGKKNMARPRLVPKVTSKYRKEAEDFDAEECQ